MSRLKINRIMLDNPVPNEDEREESAAYKALMLALDVSREIETHPVDCACGAGTCQRLQAVRRYITAHKKARVIRIAHKRLQRALDEHRKAELDCIVELDHTEALKIEAERNQLPF